MTVVGPDGNLWSSGPPGGGGATVGVGLRPLGPPAGRYTVNYRVTSADGHVVSGSWSFTVSVTAQGTPGPSAASGPTDTGLPVWPSWSAPWWWSPGPEYGAAAPIVTLGRRRGLAARAVTG